MRLEHELCYDAVRSRDPRFDGRFFTAVKTTGIYCRPICPARTPKRENVDFYPSAAAAEGAGFRPCWRCRPDAAPGTPAWAGTAATVSQALRLIAEGFLDEKSVEDLALRLGVGDRHLRRLFREHLGATPVAVAQTRRLHFARRLIDTSSLTMTDIAFASGFNSLRRFNASFRKTFGKAPGAIRTGKGRGRKEKAQGLQLTLPYRKPFDWTRLTSFLSLRAIPGVEEVAANAYRRTVSTASGMGIVEIRPHPSVACLVLRCDISLHRELLKIAGRARRLFDLACEPTGIAERLAADPLLSSLLAKHPGVRVPGAWDGFELAVRAILGQQVTVKGATTLAGRLVEAFGDPLPSGDNGSLTHLFPRPEALQGAKVSTIGLPKARARTIRTMATAVATGSLDLSASRGLDETVRRLRELPGIGDWTAQYIAMRALGEPDAFPASDLGIRKALGGLTATAVRSRAEGWRPWRSYGALLLWTADPKEYRNQQTLTE